MRIGFIGAGKVGNSLARYFAGNRISISGFYSKTEEHSKEAADYLNSAVFLSLKEALEQSDILFLTTPDGTIKKVWDSIRRLAEKGEADLSHKVICHCSGSLSSAIFSGIQELNAGGCSAHPMLAISGPNTQLGDAFFTIEGDAEAVETLGVLFERCGNPVEVIKPDCKSKYHMAASTASNLAVGLVQMALDSLEECGFSQNAALQLLGPLIRGNMENICSRGPKEALTGPVERGDSVTVEAHLDQLTGDDREIYRLLSKKLVTIAEQKNERRDYSVLRKKLEEKSK